MASFNQIEDNQWVQPRRKGYKLACCDCDLVHDLDFRIYHGEIQFRARRNRRSTAQKRRWAEKKGK